MPIKTYVEVNGKPTIAKNLEAELAYGVDIADWMPAGDTVASLTVTAVGVTAYSQGFQGTLLYCWAKGGNTTGNNSLTFHFSTAGGSKDIRTIYFDIKH